MAGAVTSADADRSRFRRHRCQLGYRPGNRRPPRQCRAHGVRHRPFGGQGREAERDGRVGRCRGQPRRARRRRRRVGTCGLRADPRRRRSRRPPREQRRRRRQRGGRGVLGAVVPRRDERRPVWRHPVRPSGASPDARAGFGDDRQRDVGGGSDRRDRPGTVRGVEMGTRGRQRTDGAGVGTVRDPGRDHRARSHQVGDLRQEHRHAEQRPAPTRPNTAACCRCTRRV